MTAKPEDAGPTIAALARESFYRLFADEAIPLAGNIAFRTVREFEAVTASPSIVAGTAGVSLGDSIRLGEDRSGDGFLILGTAWSGSGRAGLICEPPAL